MELRIFTEPQQGATYDQLLRIAQATDDLAFGAFFRSDHYLGMGTDGLPGPTDAWITLAGLARETPTIRLGTLMTSATFRHPGPLAIQVAQVDRHPIVEHLARQLHPRMCLQLARSPADADAEVSTNPITAEQPPQHHRPLQAAGPVRPPPRRQLDQRK